MSTSSNRPGRRAAIPARSVVRASAEAARQAEREPDTSDQSQEQAVGPAAEAAAPDRQRLRNGRVSYAGRAVTIYFPSGHDKDRAAAAFAARGGLEGYTSVSEWMGDCILERVQQWEDEHNDSKPYTETIAARRRNRRQ